MKVVRYSALHSGPLYTREIFLGLISFTDNLAIVLSEGLYQRKIPVTYSGVEPKTVGNASTNFATT
jgi:hypothetical protein